MLLSDAFNLYIRDYISFVGQSAKTQESYETTGSLLIDRFGDIDIETLQFSDIRDWKLFLDKGRSPNTVRGYIICLRVVLRFLRTRGHEVMNPDNIPVPKRIRTAVKYLTEDEVEKLLKAVSRPRRGYSNRIRDVALVRTLLATGLRNAEICSLRRDSIKRNTFTVIGKGNKPRIGFINDEAVEAINNYLELRTDNLDSLFITRSGKPLNPGDLRDVFERLRGRYTELRGVHPHTLRHTYATIMLKRRVDIRYVKEFMGHANLDTTAHYTHVINEDLRDIYLAAQTA